MRLPFHAFRLAAPCITPGFSECIDKALNNPPISAVIVNDVLGFPQSYDIVFSEGFYLILIFLVARSTWIYFLNTQKKNKEGE